jgi:hypothetical protein
LFFGFYFSVHFTGLFKSMKPRRRKQRGVYSEQPELTVLDPTVANHPLAPQAAGN